MKISLKTFITHHLQQLNLKLLSYQIHYHRPFPILPCLQPDSKPSNVPGDNATPSPSNAYTPTTPLSNSPTNNSNPEEATDPKDVPAPTDDDDEFVAEDHWLVQKDKLIRVHQKPRYEAFDQARAATAR